MGKRLGDETSSVGERHPFFLLSPEFEADHLPLASLPAGDI